jgi:hypothetical protein
MTELTTDQINALRKFARDKGHQWKSKLNEALMNRLNHLAPALFIGALIFTAAMAEGMIPTWAHLVSLVMHFFGIGGRH